MSTNALQTTEKALSAAKRIDEISKGAMAYFDQAGSMEAEIAVASAIGELKAALTPDVMKPIMDLMNTNLGFKTDRDPNRSNKPVTPYSVEAVRDVVIEAKLRGAHLVGNEVNIIAGCCYLTKNFCNRKVRSWPGVTDVADVYEVPRLVNGGAIVKCHATWKRDGIPDRIDREFPVKVNEHMGSDAILGKAQRKLFAAILGKLSGKTMPEGEIDDDAPQIAPAAPEAKPDMFGRGKATPAPANAPAPTPPQSGKPEPSVEVKLVMDWMEHEKLTWPQLQQQFRKPMLAKNFAFADSTAEVSDLTAAQAKLIHASRTFILEMIEADSISEGQ